MLRTYTFNRLLTLTIILIHGLSINTFAQRGKNGAKVANASNEIVNEYTTLTQNAAAGTQTIQVASSNLNAASKFTSPLQVGDLILIIQMQGASLYGSSGTPKDTSWGRVANYNNAGLYEFAEVAAIPNSTSINLNCGLTHSYTASGKVQIVRVPRYASLTVNASRSITCKAWDGSTGGVLAIEVLGQTTLTGNLDVSGKGFRGGALDVVDSFYGVQDAASTAADYGAEKGESIAGYKADYDVYGGRYCKGAPANGGGGGNAHNCGGGGGANGGALSAWNGLGNPDTTTNANYKKAWNLEYNGFHKNTSSGGGRGGYSFGRVSSGSVDPLIYGPADPIWGGDRRSNQGGYGGRPLDYTTGRLFLGGGGGAGDQNPSNRGGAGGAGGGLALVVAYNTITGSGFVLANGQAGANTQNSAFNPGKDAAGGGGAGGTIYISATQPVTSIKLQANGGKGGDQLLNNSDDEFEGPGGGGGGGYIAVANLGAGVTQTALAGNNGITQSSKLTAFPPNGATSGGTGSINQPAAAFDLVVRDTLVCGNSNLTVTATTIGTLPNGSGIVWYDAATGGNVIGNGASYNVGVVNANKTIYVGVCPGTYRLPLKITVDNSFIIDAGNNASICAGGSVQLQAQAGATSYQWSPATNLSATNIPNPIANPSSTLTYTLTATAASGCIATDQVTITVGNKLTLGITNDTTICYGDSIVINASGATSFTWTQGLGTGASHLVKPLTTTRYVVTGSDGTCLGKDSVLVSVNQPLVVTLTPTQDSICVGQSATLNTSVSGGTAGYQYNWNAGLSNQPTHVVNPSTSSRYKVQVVDAVGCKSDTLTANIGVRDSLKLATTANNLKLCAGDSLFVQAIATGGKVNAYTYSWSNGGSTAGTWIKPGSPITYTVSVSDNCSPSATTTIAVTVLPKPTFGLTANADNCNPSCVKVVVAGNLQGGIASFNFGDGSAADSLINHCYANSGTYVISADVIDTAGCEATTNTSVVIDLSKTLKADYSYSPTSPITAGTTVTFDAIDKSNGNQYNWNFGDSTHANNLATGASTSHRYDTPGTYCASLMLQNTQGCMDTVVECLTIIEDANLQLPNVFTPNADGVNDQFTPIANGFTQWECMIYNRWGTLLVTLDKANPNWNGKLNDGSNASNGVYYYIFKGTANNKELKECKGFVQLIAE